MQWLVKRNRLNSTLLHIACLVLLVLLIYSNTLNVPFQWDEEFHIDNNSIVRNLHYFSNLSEARRLAQYNFVSRRYISFLTFALNYHINGLKVGGYHIVNIYCHIANVLLVYALVLLTFRTPFMRRAWIVGPQGTNSLSNSRVHTFSRSGGPAWIAFFSAAIFAAHPVQTEAVTYIMQRFASLAAFFYLLSLVTYIKSRLTDGGEKQKGKFQRAFFYGISFISAVLAMETKENAFTLPIVIALYEFCFFIPLPDLSSTERRSFRQRRLMHLVPILLTMSIIPLVLMSQSGAFSPSPSSYGKVYNQTEYLFTEFRVMVTYLRLLFFPANQNFVYDYPVFHSFFNPQVALSFALLAALFGLGVFLIMSKDRPPVLRLIGFGIVWFFVTLSVESIVPLWMLICEYRLYLPSVGIITGFVTGIFLLGEKMERPKFRGVLMVMLVLTTVALSIAAYYRNEVFGNRIKLWADTAKKSPGIPVVHNNLGNAYMAAHMYNEAEEQFKVAIKIWPAYTMAHSNLGNCYLSLNMPDKALEEYMIAIRLDPGYVDAHNNLGVYYQTHDRPEKALEQYMIAIRLKPGYVDARINLGYYYQCKKMYAKAIEQYKYAINLNPDDPKGYNYLGNMYQILKRSDKALEQYKIAIELKPDYPDGHNNLGVYYETLNMPDKALEQYKIAIELKSGYVYARNNLGHLYQDKRMHAEAIEQFKYVIKLKPDFAAAHNNLGASYQALNMPGKALEQYMIALKLEPHFVEALNNLGLYYQSQNMLSKAVEKYKLAVKLNPSYADAHLNLGLVYYNTGKKEKAKKEFGKVLKIRPDDQKTLQLLKKISS